MTVIVLAQASDGIVVAGDGRTRLPDGTNIDNARKVRVHRVGLGGMITASSGRATLGTVETIGQVEDRFFADNNRSGCTSNTDTLAEYLRKSLENLNIARKCTCSTNYGACVQLSCCECCGLFQDFDDFEPSPTCSVCHGVAQYKWIESDGCPCSPGDGLPATEASRSTQCGAWCRCSAFAEDDIDWLCVPFGPEFAGGYSQPITATFRANHELGVEIDSVKNLFHVQGELTSARSIHFDLRSETLAEADGYETSGRVDLIRTQQRAKRLIRAAYEEAHASAFLRTVDFQDYTPENLGFEGSGRIYITQLAERISQITMPNISTAAFSSEPTIGGTPTYVSINALGEASPIRTFTL